MVAVASALTAVCIGGVMPRGDRPRSNAFDTSPLLKHLQGHYRFELLDVRSCWKSWTLSWFFFVTGPQNYVPSPRLLQYMTSSNHGHLRDIFSWTIEHILELLLIVCDKGIVKTGRSCLTCCKVVRLARPLRTSYWTNNGRSACEWSGALKMKEALTTSTYLGDRNGLCFDLNL